MGTVTMTPKTVGEWRKFSHLMNLQLTPDIEQLIRADFVALQAGAIDTATVHAHWVAIRTHSYVPSRPPEPMTRRRLLRHNVIEAWGRCGRQAGGAALRLCAEQ